MRTIASFVLLAGLAGTAATAAAQSSSPTKPDSSSKRAGQRAVRELPAVHVTAGSRENGYAAPGTSAATRVDVPLRDVPQSVSVVTRQLIADQAMQTMSDVARYVPGVSMASGEGHRDAPTIRGNSTTADFYVDGLRDDGQYLRDLYNVDRVEILKGSNALLFGRGGGGGVIDRVTRQAEWVPRASITTEGGSFDHKRVTTDLGSALGSNVSGRLDAMYERSGGFRDAATLTRFGINPTLAVTAGAHTLLRVGYEHFDDQRRVDRGIPSFQGSPAPSDITTFFGNPAVNRATSRVNLATATIEHHTDGGLTLRNRTVWGDYDLFYQNTFPAAVTAAGDRVALSAYNHAIPRRNLLNVAEATYSALTGNVRHTLLAGADLSRQHSAQFRRTGYYGDSAASYVVPLRDPTVSTPVVFRQSPTDADNNTLAGDQAIYFQDYVALSPRWRVIAGARYERFDISYHDNRSGATLRRADDFVSPRAGLVFSATEALSLYGSYSTSHLPSSGDQFSALTVTTASLEPERFTNREIGAKWEPASRLDVTAAAYRLDRTNTSAPDPVNAGVVVQTGAQRTTGVELGVTGSPVLRWQIAGGATWQQATIVSTTSAAKAGATSALVPHTTLSLWNRLQVAPSVGVGLGIIRQSDMFAAVDDAVVLPGFTRADGAVYATLRRGLRAQLNIENLLDARYFATTQGNNNIMPGAPRTLRLSLTASR